MLPTSNKPIVQTTLMFTDPRNDIIYSDIENMFSNIRYAELSVLLVYLKAYFNFMQSYHWSCFGSHFYSDHKLFEEIYENYEDEIDEVAERVISVADVANVDLSKIQFGVWKITKGFVDLASFNIMNALNLEHNILSILKKVRESLDVKGMLTMGVEDMLTSIASTHEQHVFLLKSRVKHHENP